MWRFIFLLFLHGHTCKVYRQGPASREGRAPKPQCSTDTDCPSVDLPNWGDLDLSFYLYFGVKVVACWITTCQSENVSFCTHPEARSHERCRLCSSDSECPSTDLSTFSEQIEVHRCLDGYKREYGAEVKACQVEYVDFCTHPETRSHEECQIGQEEQVYELTEHGNIACNTDSDCPPTTAPDWDGVTSITKISIEESWCSAAEYLGGEWIEWDKRNTSLCHLGTPQSFCEHELGRDHPECQRCNVLTPLPDPPCPKYYVWPDLDACCQYLFNQTSYDDEFLEEDEIELRREIQRNFTIKDCQLTGLHQPPNTPPRTAFNNGICCKFLACDYFDSNGREPHSLSAVTGVSDIRFLAETSLTRKSPSCPSGFCKRPSLENPGAIICCPLVRRRWGNARVPVCPNSCD